MAEEKHTYSIAAEPRELLAKRTKQLRRQGYVSGVVYGHKVDPQNVQIARKDFEHTYLRAGSTNLIDLSVGNGTPRKVFIHEVVRDPINYQLTHVDFLAVNLREAMTMNVPVVLVGESPIVNANEGLLLQQLDHVSVNALPTDIPSVLEVDISGLEEIDQAVHVSDITIPDKVTLLTHAEEVVAKISAMPVVEEPVVEEEETEGEETEAEAEGESGSASEDEAGEESES